MSCAVLKCGVKRYIIEKNDLQIKLHRIPKSECLRKKWLSFCGIKNSSSNVDSLFVCSNHFAQEDYHNFYDPGIRRRRLTQNAVPSVRDLPPEKPSERYKRARRKSRELLVNTLLEQYEKLPDKAPSDNTQRMTRSADYVNVQPYNEPEDLSVLFRVISPVSIGGELTEPSGSFNVKSCSVEDVNVQPYNESDKCNVLFTDISPVSIDGELTNFETEQHYEELLMGTFNPDLCSTKIVPDEFDTDPEYNMKLLCDTMISLPVQHSKSSANTPDLEIPVKPIDEPSPKRGSVTKLQTIIRHQRQTIRNLRMQVRGNTIHIKELNSQIRLLKKQNDDQACDVRTLRKACTDINEATESEIKERVRSAFLTVFTPNQTDLILGNKKRVTWASEVIDMAFSLRYHSQPAYEIIRRDMRIPLPCLRTLRQWASNIEMRKGIINDVLTVLKLAGANMTEREKVVILGYDEMSVSKTYERDKRNDEVVGPHNEMQVISARGLFSKWKQPIYVNFDQTVTLPILNEVITRLHEIGFTVVGNVHDCGAKNRTLWNDIGIDFTKEQTSMKHPVTNEDIFFFPDAPHLLKLIRNWLLDHGFYYKGKLITKKFLEFLVEKASTLQKPISSENAESRNIELNSMFKISIKHLTVQKAERQNVRLAAELLSHTTAVNLKRHFGEYEEAVLLAEIIEKINLWFDVMNSYQISQNIPSKKCYGMDLPNQNKILDDMANLMKNIRALNRHCLPHRSHLELFQKAVLISINSTKNLFLKMQEQYGVLFIMTYKLNQDFIENLFAVLRLNGGTHDHPSPLKALDRLRLVFLGKNLSQLKRNKNTEDNQVDEEFIMVRMFRIKKNFDKNKQVEDNSDDFDSDDDEPWTFVPREKCLEEEDGAEYFAGFVARGLMQNFPDLAVHIYKLENDAQEGLRPEKYVQDLSYGGLMQPTESWNNVCSQMDSFFNHLHNKSEPSAKNGSIVGFRNPKQIKQRSINKMKNQFPEVPEKILKKYIDNRINIRVRHMKKRLEEGKIHEHKIKRKRKRGKENTNERERSPTLTQNSRKLRHFVN